jgi:predicted RNA-binding Zn ribbon-like protein
MVMTVRHAVTGVNMVFAHDTELTLQAAAALANTARSDQDTLSSLDDLATFMADWDYEDAHVDDEELARIRLLRPVVDRVWTADVDDAVPVVNDLLADGGAVPQLVRHGGWDWHVHAHEVDAGLATRIAVEVGMSMVEVIRSDESDRLRTCAADDCDNLLVDLSRNRSRRYCDAGCGNRLAVAAYRARRADA